VLARAGTRTSITMSSDVAGSPKEFALVIPVPTVIQRDQVKVVQAATINHLDAYTVPRLVEYYDPDPCPAPPEQPSLLNRLFPSSGPIPAPVVAPVAAPSVRVEAEYSVGEYDIQVLSAQDSSGLITYLNSRNYRLPAGAEPVIGSYLRQHMHFFVAKVNMARRAPNAGNFLRPIKVEYDSPKFMLPIRLGTVNAKGAQDMVVLALTTRGRVETTNYQTRRMPTGTSVPRYIKADFAGFYRSAFERQVQDANGAATFLEYAWDLGTCDPCSAAPMSNDELAELGASWNHDGAYQPTFITRLHVRYDRAHFPEDLALQETGDRASYQARFLINHVFKGANACPAGQRYTASLPARYGQEARNLVDLTNWSYDDIRQRMAADGESFP
jgi:hypothetical protein